MIEYTTIADIEVNEAKKRAYGLLADVFLDKGDDDIAHALRWLQERDKWPKFALIIADDLLQRSFMWEGSGSRMLANHELPWFIFQDTQNSGSMIYDSTHHPHGHQFPTAGDAIVAAAKTVVSTMKIDYERVMRVPMAGWTTRSMGMLERDIPAPWGFSQSGVQLSSDGVYFTEASNFPRGQTPHCPRCGHVIAEGHRTSIDRNGDEIAGWRYKHPCGANILIIND